MNPDSKESTMYHIIAPTLDTFTSILALESVANDVTAGEGDTDYYLDRALTEEEETALFDAQCVIFKYTV